MHCGTCFQPTAVPLHQKSCPPITLNSFNHHHTASCSYHNCNSKQDKMSRQSGCLHDINASIRVQSPVECVRIIPQHSVIAISVTCVLHMRGDTLSFWVFSAYLIHWALASRKLVSHCLFFVCETFDVFSYCTMKHLSIQRMLAVFVWYVMLVLCYVGIIHQCFLMLAMTLLLVVLVFIKLCCSALYGSQELSNRLNPDGVRGA